MEEDTDFDLLWEGAPPQEAKRLRKLLAEWCDGDEYSFPVQLALLTKAQWRAAARVPLLVNESRQLLQQLLSEHRHEEVAIVKSFGTVTDAKLKDLKTIVSGHSEATKKAAMEMRGRLAETEAAAEQIKEELKATAALWKKAKEDFQMERIRLVEERQRLATLMNRRDWVFYIWLVALLIGVGILIGWRIPH